MKLRGLTLGVVLLATACATPEAGGWRPFNPGADFAPRTCPPDGPDSFYFPTGMLEDGYGGDAFDRQWYSAFLTRMGEPSLSCRALAADEAYRFLWLRSFHQPIVVRIARSGDRYELHAVLLSGAGGYAPGRVLRRVRRSLSQGEWERAVQVLEQMQFWALSSKPPPNPEYITVDGARWIIEGRSERYHVVDRWGGEDGAGRVGLTLVDLAGISVEPDLIY